MKLEQEKQELKKELDEVNDVQVIKAIKQLLQYAKSNKEEKALKPFTRAQLIKRAKISEQDIKRGRTTEIKQLKKDAKNW